MLIFALFSVILPACTQADRLITIVNQCPQAITPFINGQSQALLLTHGSTTTTFNDSWSGLIYTNSNGGNANGASTTRAGFFGPTNYYYIVQDTNHLNTGVSIVPKAITAELLAGGFCGTDTCDSTGCPSSYPSPPTSFPVPNNDPPSLPLAECPGTDVGYTLTFCPEKTFPPPHGTVTIHPSGSPNKCLDVRGAIYANGTAVQIYDCNKTSAQRWTLTKGGVNTSAVLAGTNFCLDAGTTPASGTSMKIWQCIDNLPAQTWEYTSGDQLQLSAINQCLDLTNGGLTNGNRVQTWTCGSTNANQIWSTS